jgi:hypothetical protein
MLLIPLLLGKALSEKQFFSLASSPKMLPSHHLSDALSADDFADSFIG